MEIVTLINVLSIIFVNKIVLPPILLTRMFTMLNVDNNLLPLVVNLPLRKVNLRNTANIVR